MIQVPEKAAYIIETLEKNGYEAYAVGGCVRDSVMGREPQDWDITTSALPGEVKKLFRRTVDTGIQHGTVTVMLGDEGFEVTTYRIDGSYEDSRHPREVAFTASLKEDLRRRDFTVNAMAYSPNAGLVDEFGGMEDIRRKILRCVGDPEERFGEDALRMLRAVRFSGQLGFSIEDRTREAIREMAPSLANISAERVREEVTKLLLSPEPEQLEAAIRTGMTAVILPEADRIGEKLPEVFRGLKWIREQFAGTDTERTALSYAMLLREAGEAKQTLKRLKFDNDTLALVSVLTARKDTVYPEQKSFIRRLVNQIGSRKTELLLFFQEALAQSREEDRAERLKNIWLGEKLFREIMDAGDCVTLKELAVKGADLMECGIRPGREMGQILNGLLELVMDEPSRNKKELLLEEVRRRNRENEEQ